MGTQKGIIDVLHDNTPSVPRSLYKYSHIDDDKRIAFARGVFERNELYFPSPDGLNDPFDSAMKCIADGTRSACKQLFREWVQRQLDVKRRKHLDFEKQFFRNPAWHDVLAKELGEEIMTKRQEFGVFCMTRKKKSILMWAHYAANHRGFCIEFQTDNRFFARARKVSYERELARVNVLSPWDTLIEHAAVALRTKSAKRNYEAEWRIIDLDHGVGIQRCPPEAISGVILGCRMLPEQRQLIRKWCENRRPRPSLYEARIKDGEFGLDIMPIPY